MTRDAAASRGRRRPHPQWRHRGVPLRLPHVALRKALEPPTGREVTLPDGDDAAGCSPQAWVTMPPDGRRTSAAPAGWPHCWPGTARSRSPR